MFVISHFPFDLRSNEKTHHNKQHNSNICCCCAAWDNEQFWIALYPVLDLMMFDDKINAPWRPWHVCDKSRFKRYP